VPVKQSSLEAVQAALNDPQTDESDTRRTLVDKVKMPGMNPAQAKLSVSVDTLWKRIMVDQLGKALQEKLREFAK